MDWRDVELHIMLSVYGHTLHFYTLHWFDTPLSAHYMDYNMYKHFHFIQHQAVRKTLLGSDAVGKPQIVSLFSPSLSSYRHS